MTNMSGFYDKLINECKTFFEREPMDDKSDGWKQNMTLKLESLIVSTS